jgi:arylsulfatase A-like enzyme
MSTKCLQPAAEIPRQPASYLRELGAMLCGAGVFLAIQFALGIWRLSQSSGGMMNKFSSLARDQYLGFLVLQNLLILAAYAMLALAATLLLQPLVSIWTRRSKHRCFGAMALRGLLLTALLHGYFTLRLAQTRPYFLNEAEFGQWYYKALDLIPEFAKPAGFFTLFTVAPAVLVPLALGTHIHRHGRRGWLAALVILALGASAFGISRSLAPTAVAETKNNKPPNVIIIGSDSLRGDRLGCAGYRPQRSDGPAAAGVSPHIDALAQRSIRFENCYTSIASTIESGIQLMTSRYPHSHGIRQMYPDRETVEKTKRDTTPIASMLREKGYDCAAIGDWCAGYYEVVPLGFEHVSVSSFDNFKIYMSQAVVMAHFVVPLYFDNALGYRVFPQLKSFAQFVTPEVVTKRVEQRLASVASEGKPFFWHVFFSCNHLPYRSAEPYVSMFADPTYRGPNRNGVDFDIDEFIGGTNLESKWKALPPAEIHQIRALYDGCTRQLDDCVAKILSALARHQLEDNTIVIITSDHGDDLYENGVTLGHGLTFNGANHANRVPMIVHLPGATPRVISEAVRLVDVAPTIADLVGIPHAPDWEGQSFASWLRGEETPVNRPFYGETGFPFIQFSVPGVTRPRLPPMDEMTFIDKTFNYQFVLKSEYREALVNAKQRCLRTANWKLVCTPTADGGRHFGLFDNRKDPDGEHNIAESRPEVLAPMRQALERWMDERIETPISGIFPDGEP